MNFENIPSPAYVIDEKKLISNLEVISNVANRAEVEIIIALKAFAGWRIFPLMNKYVKGGAASGLQEARLVYEEMHTPAHTYSPAFAEKDFDEVLKYSNHIIFNSLTQFHKFLPYIKEHKHPIEIGLRVNPEFSEVTTAIYNACTPGSRLGMSIDYMPEQLPAEISGLHFHALCESDSHNLEHTLQVVEEKFGKYFSQLKWINMGGGHLMTRQGYDTDHLVKVLTDFRKKHGLKVILEPGSAFTWDTGVLVATVLDIVPYKNLRTAILDVSFTAHMPDCLEMPYKPRVREAKEPGEAPFVYRFGGVSCLSGDYMGDWAFDQELQVGQKIIFEDMIHYTMVKTTTFNGVAHPEIGIWTKENHYTSLRKFNFYDYKNRMM